MKPDRLGTTLDPKSVRFGLTHGIFYIFCQVLGGWMMLIVVVCRKRVVGDANWDQGLGLLPDRSELATEKLKSFSATSQLKVKTNG
jgi:hypothetical protein